MRRRPARRPPPAEAIRHETGGSAIEFAFTLPLFLLVLHGLVSYGLIFALQTSMTAAANDAVRAAVQADPLGAAFESTVADLSRAAASARLQWLPEAQRLVVLGSSGENVSVSVTTDATLGDVVTVHVQFPAYASQPLLPLLRLPGLGEIPPVPGSLEASATAVL